ncbi:MAG: SecY family transport protein, partial [Cetobacterium sp.]
SSGVMPVIFASVVMMIPSLIVNMLPGTFPGRVMLARLFNDQHPVYLILYALVIIFFSFFYTAIVFDPEKVAENLKQGGGTIPSIRPGSDTADYLEGVVTRITWGGAIFLAAIAILPMILFKSFGLPIFFGGTGIIIVVGVALDTIQQIDAHLIMKEYKGFL